METKNNQGSLKSHLMPICFFLGFIIIIISIFFYNVQSGIEKNTKQTIITNVEHQRQNFENIIDLHYQYLEGAASYIGVSGNLWTENTLSILRSLAAKNDLNILSIFDKDGKGFSSDGTQQSASDADYFKEALAGNRALSGPSPGLNADNLEVVLAVPIFNSGTIIGVLGGSCNIATISSMILGDIYSGAGSILITTAEGNIITRQGEKNNSLKSGRNFFDFYKSMKYYDGVSVEDIQEDFITRQNGINRFSQRSTSYYMAYSPLGLSDWVFCYIAPLSAAHLPYRFITDYGTVLLCVFALGTLLLLLWILHTNTRTQRELLEYGQTDALTGAFNKKSTEEQIQHWLESDYSIGLQAMLMMDVDKFKQINDVHGHAVGDEILREVGDLLRHEFRDGDIIGRIGGDEFCILMKNIISETNAIAKAQNLCQRIRGRTFGDLRNISVTTSIGVAFAPSHGNSFADLYRHADAALYETKRKGRNGYTVYES